MLLLSIKRRHDFANHGSTERGAQDRRESSNSPAFFLFGKSQRSFFRHWRQSSLFRSACMEVRRVTLAYVFFLDTNTNTNNSLLRRVFAVLTCLCLVMYSWLWVGGLELGFIICICCHVSDSLCGWLKLRARFLIVFYDV